MENHFLPVIYLHVSLPHKSCHFRRSNNLLSKSTHQFIYQELGCSCVSEESWRVRRGWLVVEEESFSEEVGEHWGKQIFSLARASTVKTHFWCWCVLEVSRANISTALQWQNGGAGILGCWGEVYCVSELFNFVTLCNDIFVLLM